MEKKFNIVVGEDGTVKLPDAVLEKLEVKPGEEVRFEVDDNFYAVRLLSRIEAERLDYLNWMHNKHCPSIEEMIAESRKQATQNIVISRILDGMPAEKIAEGYEVSLDYVKQLTRTSIYNYFQTKEEIFLALLQREHETWIADLEEIIQGNESLSVDGFADALAHTLEKRVCMLKLMSMNLYDMEGNSRLENLAVFKQSYAGTLRAVTCCLEKFFPGMTPGDIQNFIYAFFPFLFGIYPYTSHTEKQLEAMKLAHVNHIDYSVYEIVKTFIARLLRSFH